MKRKKIIITILIVLIGVLSLVGLAGYILNKSRSNAYGIYKKMFNSVYENIKNQYNYNANAIEGNITYKASAIDYNDPSDILDIIAGNNYNLNFNVDYKNEIALFDLESKYKDSDSITIKKYLEDNKIYTNISDSLDNYVWELKSEEDYKEIFNNLKLKREYLTIIEGFKNAFLSENNKEYFYQSNEVKKYELNGKTYNTYLNFFIINKTNYKEIISNIDSNLKNNEDFLNAYKDVFNKDYNILNFSDVVNYFVENELYIIVYTDMFTGQTVSMDITVNKGKVYKTLSIDGKEDNYNFKFNSTDFMLSGKINIGNKRGSIEISTTDKLYQDIKINVSYNFKYVDKIDKEDVSGATSIFNMTSEEYGNVYKAILNRTELNNIYDVYELYKLKEDPNYLTRPNTFIW